MMKKSLSIFLFLFFFLTYFTSGIIIFEEHASELDDIILDADIFRVIQDIQDTENSNHYRTGVHPLFVILLRPLSYVLELTFGSTVLIAFFLNSIAASLIVVFSFLFFKKLNYSSTFSFTFSFILGVSCSILLFGSAVETHIFSGLSVVLLYYLLLLRLKSDISKKNFFWLLLCASVFSIGMNLMNAIHIIIVIFFSKMDYFPKKRQFYNAFYFLGLFSFITILLSLFQKLIFASSRLFFMIQSSLTKYDVGYFSFDNFLFHHFSIILLIKNTFISFFITPFIGPNLSFYSYKLSFITYNPDFSIYGLLSFYLLSIIILINFFVIYKMKIFKMPIFKAISAGLIITILFHLIYAPKSVIVFAPNFIFLVVAIISAHALAFNHIKNSKWKIGYYVVLWILILLIVINNIKFMNVISIFLNFV